MKEKCLITIERSQFSQHKIYGFILAESKKLLMIQEVVDLRLDGILIIDKKEITDCYTDFANAYQTEMLKAFGIYQQIDFTKKYDIKNWKRFFKSVAKDFPYCEINDDRFGVNMFYIGKILKIKKKSLHLHEFSGAGNWYDKPTKIPYSHISTCGIGTHYVQTYANYFVLNKA